MSHNHNIWHKDSAQLSQPPVVVVVVTHLQASCGVWDPAPSLGPMSLHDQINVPSHSWWNTYNMPFQLCNLNKGINRQHSHFSRYSFNLWLLYCMHCKRYRGLSVWTELTLYIPVPGMKNICQWMSTHGTSDLITGTQTTVSNVIYMYYIVYSSYLLFTQYKKFYQE